MLLLNVLSVLHLLHLILIVPVNFASKSRWLHCTQRMVINRFWILRAKYFNLTTKINDFALNYKVLFDFVKMFYFWAKFYSHIRFVF